MKIVKLEKMLYFCEFEVDYYVPISVKFPENNQTCGNIAYYQFINSRNSFIEVSINCETKKIIDITLVSINDIEDKEFHIKDFYESTPIIDISIFSIDNVVKETAEFNMYKFNKSIYFILDNEEIESAVKLCEHVYLFSNKNSEIIGMYFSKFTKFEWNEIEESINNRLTNL